MKDLAGLMKQAQEMQSRMREAQERLETLEVTGESGAGLIRVTLTAKGEMRALAIDPSLIDPAEPEVLEDLIKAAHADARRKAETAQQKVLSEATQGIGLPPGFDMPFGIKPGG
ncbi:YbaB/EbfC family nucleoid-associated protein [Alkalicaulis satelles]|uniref:Nucleoid-associated protein F1654_02020 n=1 Tax=Alkalicaulis satelles TaxID=2609175 RepID=A0A5M6ZJ36_9PROT|nr:YbaB/EbfC family nucleoid-associated protein [Alkalicaulis satelles]KAA5804799.1 YbaB/EbfC family nucleoid-associated protein [Alkalicaulis satelles]